MDRLWHYILLREVKKERNNIILFKLLSQKVFFGQEVFDTITELRARSRCPIKFDTDKALRLRHLYLGDRFNMNRPKSDKDYTTLNFESHEDAMKMWIFYFIELAMIGRERRQYIDWTVLGFIDDLEDFVSYD